VDFKLPTGYLVNFASKIFVTSLFKHSNQIPVGGTRAIILLPFPQSSSPEGRIINMEMKKNGKKYRIVVLEIMYLYTVAIVLTLVV
jgi:hypothetical protein